MCPIVSRYLAYPREFAAFAGPYVRVRPGLSKRLLLPHCCHFCHDKAFQMLPVANPVRKLVGEKLAEA